MSSPFLQLAAMAVWLAIDPSLCLAQKPTPTRDPVQELQSADWGKRADAFKTLQHRPGAWTSSGMADVLLQLLEREDQEISMALRPRTDVDPKFGHGFREYQTDLFWA